MSQELYLNILTEIGENKSRRINDKRASKALKYLCNGYNKNF